MAIYKTPAEMRKFELTNGKTVDLIALIGTYKEIMHRETWVNPTVAPEIGTVAYVDAMGDMRRGVVTKTTKTKTYVAVTTQGAVDSAAAYEAHVGAARGSQPVRVQIVIADTNYVRVAPAPEPTPEPEAPAFDPEAGASAPEANRAANQTGGVEGLTLNSHGGKVDNNSEDEPEGDEMTAETTIDTPAKKHTGSAVVIMMERVWARIRENHPELPDVVIVTGMGSDASGLKWGHFRADGWKVMAEDEGASIRLGEMFMAGETKAKGALQVLQTMLHEGAHALARIREIQDTSRQHRWHNAKFRALGEEMGLAYPHSQADKSLGFSSMVLTDETKAEYADLLDELDKEISLVISLPGWLGGLGGLLGGLGGDPLGGDGVKGRPAGPTTSNGGNVKLTCGCEEPNIIRASKKVADKMVVNCGDCDELFKVR
jgi:hypothetical protein